MRRLTWQRYACYWGLGLAAVAVVLLACLMVGEDIYPKVHFTYEWPHGDALFLRLRRVGTAALVGAALSASGVAWQGLLRNPLAEPYVLGISSGSTVGVMLWLMMGTQIANAAGLAGVLPDWVQYGQAAPALLGALVACVVVFIIARAVSPGGVDPLTLLLVGVVVSSFCGAVVMLLNSIAPYGFRESSFDFLVGHVEETALVKLAIGGGVFAVGWAIALLSAGAMNVASLSDVEATSLGVRLGRLRSVCFFSASIMTAAAIALARSIGFVGLICPHICRLLFGPDHRQLIVTAPFCGAIFLMLADALVQVMRPVFPAFVPVGVVTALIGAPCFLLLLARRGAVAND